MLFPPIEDIREGAILLIDKPKGWTSFDIVRKVKNASGAKTGHGGTLDPLASGLMIIATGKFTKKLTELTGLDKSYTGKMILGATTPSFDLETQIDQTFDISQIETEEIFSASKSFIGEIQQIPPVFSAIKIDGKRSYDMARAGKEVEMKSRLQTIFQFDITDITLPEISFFVHCNKGTYIRSLVSDFGKALNSGAYMSELRRVSIGPYKLSDAYPIAEFIAYLRENNPPIRHEDLLGN